MQRHSIVTAATLCGSLLLAACSSELPGAPSSLSGSVLGASGAQTALAASITREPMRVFSTGAVLPGTSSLVRNDNGISMTVHATGLTPQNAYTVWFVIFNDPSGCDGGVCDVQDVLNNRGVPSLRFGAGHVVGASGQGNFGGQLAEGNTGGPACAAGPTLGSCGPGLLDTSTAEVHLVVRSHGAAIPGLVNEQISSFGGGCQVNACANVQVSVHLPEQES